MQNNLKSLLRRKKSTQAALAKAARVSPAAVSFYVSGRTNPTDEVASRIAKFFSVSIKELGLAPPGRPGPKSIPGRINRSAVEAALKRLRISGSELARRLGMARQAVSHYMVGRAMPRPAMLRRLAKMLNIDQRKLVIPDDGDRKARRSPAKPAKAKPAKKRAAARKAAPKKAAKGKRGKRR